MQRRILHGNRRQEAQRNLIHQMERCKPNSLLNSNLLLFMQTDAIHQIIQLCSGNMSFLPDNAFYPGLKVVILARHIGQNQRIIRFQMISDKLPFRQITAHVGIIKKESTGARVKRSAQKGSCKKDQAAC